MFHRHKNTDANIKELFLSDKNILFIENDYTLNNGLDFIEEFLIENKVKYNVLYNCRQLPFEYIIDMVKWYDVVIFQTQWVYESSLQLSQHFMESKDKKIFVEVPVSREGTWYYKPDVVHDVYMVTVDRHGIEGVEVYDPSLLSVYKLRKNKAIWHD